MCSPRSTSGWSLSPAFDLNPNPAPGPKRLRLAIDFDRTDAKVATLIDVAPQFRLGAEQARSILGEVLAATSKWREQAKAAGLGTSALEQMAPAFEADRDAAERLLAG